MGSRFDAINMIYCPKKYQKEFVNLNEEYLQLKGEQSDKDAKIQLVKFLRHNLGYTTDLISGIQLAAYQELTLRGFFNRNFSLAVFGRGLGKSFLAAVYCFLQCIFEPNTKILIVGPTFRTARNIFDELEKMINSQGAKLLQQAFSVEPPIRRNDILMWNINGGSIKAIPLNGEKIRGFRANILLLDEFLLLSKEIVDNVLAPFLVAPHDMRRRLKIRAEEDEAIQRGEMKEEDRMQFERNSRMICLSSASYTFENLYETYIDWMNKIYDEKVMDNTYFIAQLGWEAVPQEMLDPTIIEEARSANRSEQSYLREFCARFTDGSDSFYSAKKMFACTIPDCSEPTVEIVGKSGDEYILAIDPSFSNSPSSDDFAMSLMKINRETKTSTLVNSYGVAGGNLKDHINYLYYLLTKFNIIMIVVDNAGWTFIDSCNESEHFRSSNIHLKFFDFDSDREGIEYSEMLKVAKSQYNKTDYRIVFKCNFSSDFIRKANEHMQACIEHKRVWFASHLTPHPVEYERATHTQVETRFLPKSTLYDFIAYQDGLIDLTKKECNLIEITSTIKGTQSFDLPQNLKRNTSANRARKDNYTSLLLGCWGVKCYFDIINVTTQKATATFTPIIIA